MTQIDLDDDALAEVMRIAQVHTKKEAVNLALRDYAERFRRVEALARSREHEVGVAVDRHCAVPAGTV